MSRIQYFGQGQIARNHQVLRHWLRRFWKHSGKLRYGLARGLRSYECFGLPRLHPPALSLEEQFYLAQDFRGKIIYDVGAHNGMLAMYFARAAGPAGQVVAWEPLADTFRSLEANLRLNRFENVLALPIALGEREERREFYFCSAAAASGTVTGCRPAQAGVDLRAGEAQVETLDGARQRRSLPPPDWIKIDVEGMEAEVLAGARETLRRYHPQLVVEMHGIGVEAKLANARRVLSMLHWLGYRCRHIETRAEITLGDAGRILHGHLHASTPP